MCSWDSYLVCGESRARPLLLVLGKKQTAWSSVLQRWVECVVTSPDLVARNLFCLSSTLFFAAAAAAKALVFDVTQEGTLAP